MGEGTIGSIRRFKEQVKEIDDAGFEHAMTGIRSIRCSCRCILKGALVTPHTQNNVWCSQ